MAEKLEENKTEGILKRIVNRTVEGMRTGLNIEKNRGILETLAERASSKEGQFYATLADPNAYYDKQGFGSAGTGMRSAQGAYQGAVLAKAKARSAGMATPTSELNNKRLLFALFMGTDTEDVLVPDPYGEPGGEPVPFSSLPLKVRLEMIGVMTDQMQGVDLSNNPMAMRMFRTKVKGASVPKDRPDNFYEGIGKKLGEIWDEQTEKGGRMIKGIGDALRKRWEGDDEDETSFFPAPRGGVGTNPQKGRRTNLFG